MELAAVTASKQRELARFDAPVPLQVVAAHSWKPWGLVSNPTQRAVLSSVFHLRSWMLSFVQLLRSAWTWRLTTCSWSWTSTQRDLYVSQPLGSGLQQPRLFKEVRGGLCLFAYWILPCRLAIHRIPSFPNGAQTLGRYKIDKIRPEEKEVYLKFERSWALGVQRGVCRCAFACLATPMSQRSRIAPRSKRQLAGLHFVARTQAA